jgi:transglutaminase superfamily protein
VHAASQHEMPSDRTLASRALVVGLVAPLLARCDLPRLQRLLEPRRRADAGPDVAATAQRVGILVDRTMSRAGPAIRPGCLVRGITRYSVLRRAGVDVALCFGLGHNAGALEGHCWLTLGPDVLFEPPDATPAFTSIVRVSRTGVHR